MQLLNLQCEYSSAPIGIGTCCPRFSWNLQAKNDIRQIGYRVRIYNSSDCKIADTGMVNSMEQRVKMQELPLEIQSVYRWRLTAFLSDGSSLDGSASFETSFFSVQDWKDDWVTPIWVHIPPEKQSVTFLRGEFPIHSLKNVRRARAYVGATTGIHGNMTARMNMYRFRVNGQAVNDDALNPGQLSPRRGRGLVRTFDLLPFLREGENAAGLIFISAKISVRILIEYSDGKIDRFSIKDGLWLMRPRGPFVRLWTHNIAEYDGKSEYYDAREEFTGWDLPGFRNTEKWQTAEPIASPDILTAQMQSASPYLRCHVKTLKRWDNGRFVVDFGENRNGFVRILTKGAAGTMIRLNYSEAVSEDGLIDPVSTFSAQMELSIHHDIYWKKTDNPEWYEPSFSLHGFRYVEILGMPELTKDDLEAVYVMSTVNAGFEFHCSDMRIQELMQLCVRGCQSNLMSVPTDCCTRERLGWGADAAAVSRFECAVFDLRLFYEKWFRDLADEQNTDGSLPILAPFAIPLSCNAIPWSRGYVALAMDAWEHYGDLTFIAQVYQIFRRFGEYLIEIEDTDGLSRHHCAFSDHFCKDSPDSVFLENAHALNSLQLITRFAEILGRCAEACNWRSYATRRMEAINHCLRNGISYGANTQSEAVHALAFHIVPEENRAMLLEKLCTQLKEECFVRTGYTGTELLMRVLEEENCREIAWKLLSSNKPYTWGHWLDIGLTTAPEMWCPDLKSNPRTTLNHPALCGGAASWMIRVLAGIRPLEPGYRKTLVAPYLPTEMNAFSIALPTPRGILTVECRRDNIRITAPHGIEIVRPDNVYIEEKTSR